MVIHKNVFKRCKVVQEPSLTALVTGFKQMKNKFQKEKKEKTKAFQNGLQNECMGFE